MVNKDAGWYAEKEVGGLGCPPWRKLVTIELPDGVTYGKYNIGATTLTGLHSECNANDGMGSTVFVWSNLSAPAENGKWEAAIDAAIASGITLSVPVPGGNRIEIAAPVVSVSAMSGAILPE